MKTRSRFVDCVINALGTLLIATSLSAAPLGVNTMNETSTLSGDYILATDETHDALEVTVSMTIRRAQLAPSADVTFRYRATLNPVGGGTPVATAGLTRAYTVPGIANIPVTETLTLDPSIILDDTIEYQLEVIVVHFDDPEQPLQTTKDASFVTQHRIAHLSGNVNFNTQAATIQTLAQSPFFLFNPSTWRIRVDTGQLPNGIALSGNPAAPFLDVQRDNATGDLNVLSGELLVDTESDIELSGWQATLGETTLSNDGVQTDQVCLTLPPGIGVRSPSPFLPQYLSPTLCTLEGDAIALDATTLLPSGKIGGSGPLEFVSDAFPVTFTAPSWSYTGGQIRVVNPTAQFVRANAYQSYQAQTGDKPESNLGYYEHLANNALSTLIMTPGLDGGVTVSLGFNAGGGDFSSFFPLAETTFSGGTINITDNRINNTSSGLDNPQITLFYSRLCPPCPGQPWPDKSTLDQLTFSSNGLTMTPTGGLSGFSLLPPALGDLAIGEVSEDDASVDPVHQLSGLNSHSYYMPGGLVPWEDGLDSSFDSNNQVDDLGEAPLSLNPARYLLSGNDRTQFTLEHPFTDLYFIGAADYAGLNYRHNPGLTASSTIGGGSPVAYPPSDRWKGYARQSGFSGIHEADPDNSPPQIVAYDYTINLSNFGFGYLSNGVASSRTDGEVNLPYPSLFTVLMDDIMINCCGNPTSFTLSADDPNDNAKQLSYWHASDIRLLSGRFALGEECEDQCDDDGLLALSVVGPVGGIPDEHFGTLFIDPLGNLSNCQELKDRFSRLHVGPTTLRGQAFLPNRPVYFNDRQFQVSNAMPGPGWQNLIGMLDLAFFEDAATHVLTYGNADEALVNVQVRDGYWGNPEGNHFFNSDTFDSIHKGYPGPVPLGRPEFETQEAFHAVFEKDWFGGRFSFPLRYFDSPTEPYFFSESSTSADLAITFSDSRVNFLNTDTADIEFGKEIELLPKLTFSNIAALGIDSATNPLLETAQSQLDDIQQQIDTVLVTFSSVSQSIVRPNFYTAVDTVIATPLITTVRIFPFPCDDNDIDNAVTGFFETAAGNFETIADDAADTILGVDIAGPANNVKSSLISVRDGVVNFRDEFLTEEIISGLIQNGLQQYASNGSIDPDMIQGLTSDLLLENGPFPGMLAVARERSQQLIDALNDAIDAVEENGAYLQELQGTLAGIPVQMSDVIGVDVNSPGLMRDVRNYLLSTICVDPNNYTNAELSDHIATLTTDAMLNIQAIAGLETALRNETYILFESVQELLDSTFVLVNATLKDAATALLIIPDAPLRAVQGFGTHFLTSDLRGHAITKGDTLDSLHLDGRFGLHLPTEVEFKGYLRYKHLTSTGVTMCDLPAATRQHELIIGGSAGTAKFLTSVNRVDVQAKFGFDSNRIPRGFAGSLEMTHGSFNFAALTALNFNAHMAIGGEGSEYYLSSGISAELPYVGNGVAFSGGNFFGRTCSLGPLPWLPEKVPGEPIFLPADPPFSGGVIHAQGAYNLFGRNCLARLRVGGGVGGYFLVEDNSPGVTWGGRIFAEASGELFCIFNGKGRLLMEAKRRGGETEFIGRASIVRKRLFGGTKTRGINATYRPSDRGFKTRR